MPRIGASLPAPRSHATLFGSLSPDPPDQLEYWGHICTDVLLSALSLDSEAPIDEAVRVSDEACSAVN
jgi:hypothetical protein